MTLEEYELYAANISTDERKELPDTDFALPSKRMFPLKDNNHVRLAWDMVDRAKGLSDSERAEARRNILKRAKESGIDTSTWKQSMKAAAVQFSFSDNSTNPNRMPFKGVLTYFDAPSDKPPGGSGGRKVLIPSSVGIPALESLKGMGVNLAAEADDHEVQHKIGVITDAYTGQMTAKGLEVFVEGHIFARDFPREASIIKLNQSSLGFSYETANTLLASQEINGEEIAVAESLVFTGAAILLKKAAAYQSTSIAASAKLKEEIINVTPEELKALFGDLKTDILAAVDDKMKAAKKSAKTDPKDEDEEDGVKADAADDLQTEQADNPKKGTKSAKPGKAANGGGEVKASGEIDYEKLAAAVAAAIKPATTEVQASSQPPARKSLDSTSLMAKYNVDVESTSLVAAIDKLARDSGVNTTESFALKLEGLKSGQITY